MKKFLVFAVLALFIVKIQSDEPAIKQMKTIPISQAQYIEMKEDLDKNGKYFFWEHDIAIVITNKLHEVESPYRLVPKPGAHNENRRNQISLNLVHMLDR